MVCRPTASQPGPSDDDVDDDGDVDDDADDYDGDDDNDDVDDDDEDDVDEDDDGFFVLTAARQQPFPSQLSASSP